jgi:phenylacetic acid degradation operon negative regulatory protein
MLKAMADLEPAPGDDTMFAFLRMVSEWQQLPWTDPQLPEALLPDWIGRRVARRIEELRARWTPEARRRFAELDSARGLEV